MIRNSKRFWLRQLGIVTGTFMLIAYPTALGLFANAPRIWSGSAIAALAAALGGGLGWVLLCGFQARPSWRRTVLAGVFAGVVVHPINLLLASFYYGEAIAWSDWMAGSIFFLLVGGIITIPAGIAAAVACRIAGGWWNPSLEENSQATEPNERGIR